LLPRWDKTDLLLGIEIFSAGFLWPRIGSPLSLMSNFFIGFVLMVDVLSSLRFDYLIGFFMLLIIISCSAFKLKELTFFRAVLEVLGFRIFRTGISY